MKESLSIAFNFNPQIIRDQAMTTILYLLGHLSGLLVLALDDHPVGSLPDDAEVVILVHGSASLVHGTAHVPHLSMVMPPPQPSSCMFTPGTCGCCASLDHWLFESSKHYLK